MHRVVKPAIGSTLLTSVMLVLASILFHYLSVESLRVPGSIRQYVVDPFVWSTSEMLQYRAKEFFSFLPLSAVWSIGVVVPVLLLAARQGATPARQRAWALVAVAVVGGACVLSHQVAVGNVPGTWRGEIAFSVGALIGLAGAAVATWLLPPNTSLERTLER